MGTASPLLAPGEKRFSTIRSWNNLKAVLIGAPFVLSAVAGVGLASGQIRLIFITGALVAAAIVLAMVRDRQRPALYRIADGMLHLSKGSSQASIPAAEILDVSLMDRIASRDYVKRKVVQQRLGDRAAKAAARDAFMRFCSVDVGLRTYSFGLGRLFIDRMESARRDLLLLRLKTGQELLLSPERIQEMMEQISRIKRRAEEPSALA